MITWKKVAKNALNAKYPLKCVMLNAKRGEQLPNLVLSWTKSAKLGAKCEILRELDKVLLTIFR